MSGNQKMLLWIGIAVAAFLLFGDRLRMMFAGFTTRPRTITKQGTRPLASHTPDLRTLAVQSGAQILSNLPKLPLFTGEESIPPSDNGPSLTFGDYGSSTGADVGIGANPVVWNTDPFIES